MFFGSIENPACSPNDSMAINCEIAYTLKIYNLVKKA